MNSCPSANRSRRSVIVAMLSSLVARMGRDGSLVLSGLLLGDEPVIAGALARLGLQVRWRRAGEWASACARRAGDLG